MARKDKGNFSAKHENQQINETIASKIRDLAVEKCLTCSAAHRIAKQCQVSPAEVGVQIDLLEYRISECQLGLFGYADGGKKIAPDIHVSSECSRMLDQRTADNRISCLACWDIARDLKLTRLDISAACEQKNIKINACQLGAF
jgi:hypothetical protein